MFYMLLLSLCHRFLPAGEKRGVDHNDLRCWRSGPEALMETSYRNIWRGIDLYARSVKAERAEEKLVLMFLCCTRSSRCLKTTIQKGWRNCLLSKVISYFFKMTNLAERPIDRFLLFLSQPLKSFLWPTTSSSTFWVRPRDKRSASWEVRQKRCMSLPPVYRVSPERVKFSVTVSPLSQPTGRRCYWTTSMLRSCRRYTGVNWRILTETLAVATRWVRLQHPDLF